MSEQPSSGSRPLLPGQIASWLRLVCFIAAALIVTAYAYLAVRQSFGNQGNPVSADQVKAVRAATAGRSAMWTTAELGLK